MLECRKGAAVTAQSEGVSTDFLMPDLSAVRAEAASVDTRAVLSFRADEEFGASRAAVALALWEDQSLSTNEIKAAAEARCVSRHPELHTFVPLYTTNH